MSGYSNLFSPVKIGSCEIKNRTAMMAMGLVHKKFMNMDGSFTKQGADYYIERAKGGTGLIITSVCFIEKNIGNHVNMSPSIMNNLDSYAENQKYLMEGCHKYGAKVFVQISAGNGRSGIRGTEKAPAPIQNVWNPLHTSPGLTEEEIWDIIHNFGEAALAVKKAGGDGVEVHAIHEGYLIDQFATSCFNRRSDEWGGSLDNRLKFACEIVKSIKESCGSDFPVIIRYSVTSKMRGFNRGVLPEEVEGVDYVEFGRNMEESRKAVKILEKAGYDALDADNGTYDSWYWPHPPVYMPKACNLNDVAEIKKEVHIPVICAGRFDDPQLADEAIAAGKMDMLGMGRPLLADADSVNKFKDGQYDDVRPCIGCHQGCMGQLLQGKPTCCAVNPACGREESYAIKPADVKKKVLVIGGGLGGMEAARVCAIRGHEVHLYEKSSQLGGVFAYAAAPKYKEDDKRLLQWYVRQLEQLKVTIHLNTEVTEELLDSQDFDEIFVATGATERTITIPGVDDSNRYYAIDALQKGTEQIEADDVVVIGGGLTGTELAVFMAKEGKHVTLVEMAPTILNVDGMSAANYNMLMDMLDIYGVNVMKNAHVVSVQDGEAEIEGLRTNEPNSMGRARLGVTFPAKGKPFTVKVRADQVIVSVGYISNTVLYDKIREKYEHVYLIGDAKQPANVMAAIWDAYEIGMNL